MGQKFSGLWGLLRNQGVGTAHAPFWKLWKKKINHAYSVDRIQFLTTIGLRFCFLARCQLRAVLFLDATCIPWHLVSSFPQSSKSVSMG